MVRWINVDAQLNITMVLIFVQIKIVRNKPADLLIIKLNVFITLKNTKLSSAARHFSNANISSFVHLLTQTATLRLHLFIKCKRIKSSTCTILKQSGVHLQVSITKLFVFMPIIGRTLEGSHIYLPTTLLKCVIIGRQEILLVSMKMAARCKAIVAVVMDGRNKFSIH